VFGPAAAVVTLTGFLALGFLVESPGKLLNLFFELTNPVGVVGCERFGSDVISAIDASLRSVGLNGLEFIRSNPEGDDCALFGFHVYLLIP
jgi:hypothetical protein